MRIAICDDEQVSIDVMVRYFETQEPYPVKITTYKSGEQLLCEYIKDMYDVIFLDLEMPVLNGIETAEAIRKIDGWVPIVFVTSHSQYMKSCFKCMPLGFVEKSRLELDIKDVMQTVLARLKRKRYQILIKGKEGDSYLYSDEILYCEKCAHYVEIHTKNAIYRQRLSLKELEEMLPKEMFFRISRGYLVNLRYIKKITGYSAILYDGNTELPIGRAQKEAFKKALLDQKMKETDNLWSI